MEYENEAEQILADMEFSANDLPQDRALKIQVIQIYNAKLDERERRKKFVTSRGLLDYRKNQQADSKLPQDERDLLRRLRLFERLQTPEEHKCFVAGLLKAKRIRKDIAKLQMYRRLGIRTLAEAEKYELDKERRDFHKRARLQKELEAEKSDSVHSKGGSKEASQSSMGLDDDVSSSLWKQYRTSDRKNRRSINRTSPGGPAAIEANAGEVASEKTSEPTVESIPAPKPVDKPTDSETATVEAQEAGPKEVLEAEKEPTEKEDDSSLKREPGYELLTAKEVVLCKKIDLNPSQYLKAKKALIQASLVHGLLDKESQGSSKRSIVKIDVEKKGDVVDFMIQAGWISSKIGTIV